MCRYFRRNAPDHCTVFHGALLTPLILDRNATFSCHTEMPLFGKCLRVLDFIALCFQCQQRRRLPIFTSFLLSINNLLNLVVTVRTATRINNEKFYLLPTDCMYTVYVRSKNSERQLLASSYMFDRPFFCHVDQPGSHWSDFY